MVGSLTDFNDCVSKGAFITEQRNLMTELTRNVNNLVTCIEQVEQRPHSHHGDDEDADGDLSDHEDMDDDGDARNRRRYYFNRRGVGGNNHGNNDPFAKIKFSLPPFAGNIDFKALFSFKIFYKIDTVALSFLFDKYYPIMD